MINFKIKNNIKIYSNPTLKKMNIYEINFVFILWNNKENDLIKNNVILHSFILKTK